MIVPFGKMIVVVRAGFGWPLGPVGSLDVRLNVLAADLPAFDVENVSVYFCWVPVTASATVAATSPMTPTTAPIKSLRTGCTPPGSNWEAGSPPGVSWADPIYCQQPGATEVAHRWRFLQSGKLRPMRVSTSEAIVAPEFPRGLPWLNVAFLRMDQLIGRAVVLVEFWDFARVNSLRTLPYLKAWHERYAGSGLRVILVQSPGYSFGRDPEVAARAVERLEVPMPVALDPDFAVWREYGNRGWPGRYLFDREGVLRQFHYGEGAYEETELAVQELLHELDPDLPFPEPLEPLRPEDAPGVMLEAQTADIALPADRARLDLVRDWSDGEDFIEARDAGAAATVRSFTAGSAWAVLSGGEIEPGLYEMDGTVVAESPGTRLHGVQFTPSPPPSPS